MDDKATISLANGKYITIDQTDLGWIEQEQWQWVVKKSPRTSIESIWIESVSEKYRYLHNLFFPNRHSHSIIEFSNGDPFDYRRSNLIKLSYYARSISKRKDSLKAMHQLMTKIEENDCYISPTNKPYRSLLCVTCSLIDDTKYEKCLDMAADRNWLGWDITQMSMWCSYLNDKIKEAQLEERE